MRLSVRLFKTELLRDYSAYGSEMLHSVQEYCRECYYLYFCVINVLHEQSQIPDLRELASTLSNDFRRSRVFIFRKCSNPPILTFLSIKSPISATQKVIAYHWKGNRITYVMSRSNDQNYHDFNNKNGKN